LYYRWCDPDASCLFVDVKNPLPPFMQHVRDRPHMLLMIDYPIR
jgi:hypothetical protein